MNGHEESEVLHEILMAGLRKAGNSGKHGGFDSRPAFVFLILTTEKEIKRAVPAGNRHQCHRGTDGVSIPTGMQVGGGLPVGTAYNETDELT